MSVNSSNFEIILERVERERRERAFLSEVERRAGASREEMLDAIRNGVSASVIDDWLRRILGEKP